MDIKDISAKAEEIIAPVVNELGYSIVECEYTKDLGSRVLRVYIERADVTPISVDDCTKVSREISGVLDVEDVIPTKYLLEVSSPGLNRPLRREADFIKYSGQKARIRTKEQINGRGNYLGTLHGMEGSDILINVDGTEYKVPLNMIAKARLEFK